MNKQKIEHYKKLLMEEKNSVENTVERMNENEPNDSMGEYFGELSVYDNHPADLGTEMFMMEQNMNLKTNELHILSSINNSLEKIENGTYGKCDICGNDIEKDRLEVLPYAQTCIGCNKEEMSSHKMMNTRPIEEDNLQVPFARTYKDNADDNFVGFDGEDSLQAVLRYEKITNDPSFNGGDHLGVFDEDEVGDVENVENISNEYYHGQIPGLERDDIPDEQKERQK